MCIVFFLVMKNLYIGVLNTGSHSHKNSNSQRRVPRRPLLYHKQEILGGPYGTLPCTWQVDKNHLMKNLMDPFHMEMCIISLMEQESVVCTIVGIS